MGSGCRLEAPPIFVRVASLAIAGAALLIGLAGCGKDKKITAPASAITITQPTSDLRYDTFSNGVRIEGTVSGAASVHWFMEPTSVSGDATVDAVQGTWFADIHNLAPTSNRITFTAVPLAAGGQAGTAVLVVRYDPHLDHEPPSIAITVPTVQDTFVTTLNPITLKGVAGDNSGNYDVLWKNLDSGVTGIATLGPPWEAQVPLLDGENQVVVTARDYGGNTASDTALVILTVTQAAQAAGRR